MNDNKSRVNVYVDSDLLKQAQMQAIADNTNFSALVERGLRLIVREKIEKSLGKEAIVTGKTASEVATSTMPPGPSTDK